MPDPNTISEHLKLPNTAGVYNEFFTEFNGMRIDEYLETFVNKTKVRNYPKTEDEVISLSSEVKTFFTIMEQSKQVKQQISMFDGLVECENLLTYILGSSQGIKELETEIKQITLDVQTVKMLKDLINIINSNIVAFTVRFKKEMPAICPLCGNNTI